MFSIMEQKNGAGLAAPQIGVSERVIVFGGLAHNPRYPTAPAIPKTYAINPKILWQSEEVEDFEEGCLSVPGLRGMVSRPTSIIYQMLDFNGTMHERKASGFEARVFQHEVDHLNGILFIDRVQQATLRQTNRLSLNPS